MNLSVEIAGRTWRFNPEQSTDWTTPVAFSSGGAEAFGLTERHHRAVDVGGGFVLEVAKGASVNCANVTFNPHSHGTHTECVGHITADRRLISEITIAPLLPATMVSVAPVLLSSTDEGYDGSHRGDDHVISGALLERALASVTVAGFDQALVLRCVEAPDASRAWSGTNPPYLTREAIDFLSRGPYQHLITDLPSLDREDDGGGVPNHRAWWGLAAGASESSEALFAQRTVTEMAFIGPDQPDGPWLLSLQPAALESDAAPSRLLAMRPQATT